MGYEYLRYTGSDECWWGLDANQHTLWMYLVWLPFYQGNLSDDLVLFKVCPCVYSVFSKEGTRWSASVSQILSSLLWSASGYTDYYSASMNLRSPLSSSSCTVSLFTQDDHDKERFLNTLNVHREVWNSSSCPEVCCAHFTLSGWKVACNNVRAYLVVAKSKLLWSGAQFGTGASCVRQAELTGPKRDCLLSTFKKLSENTTMTSSHHRMSANDERVDEIDMHDGGPNVKTSTVDPRDDKIWDIKSLFVQLIFGTHRRLMWFSKWWTPG